MAVNQAPILTAVGSVLPPITGRAASGDLLRTHTIKWLNQ